MTARNVARLFNEPTGASYDPHAQLHLGVALGGVEAQTGPADCSLPAELARLIERGLFDVALIDDSSLPAPTYLAGVGPQVQLVKVPSGGSSRERGSIRLEASPLDRAGWHVALRGTDSDGTDLDRQWLEHTEDGRTVEGRPVRFQSARSAAARALAIDQADVVVSAYAGFAQAVSYAADLRAQLARRNRSASSVRILAEASVVVGATPAEAKAKAQRLAERPSRRPTFVGTPAGVADQWSHYVRTRAVDGFVVTRDSLADVVNLLVPELQERGVYRRAYISSTLRGRLGLPPVGISWG